MKQIYYDSFMSGLIPVGEPRKVPADDMAFGAGNMYYVRVQKSTGAYVKHEVLKVHASSLVHKTGMKDGHIMVTPWRAKEAA